MTPPGFLRARSWGAHSVSARSPLHPWPPVARRLGASKHVASRSYRSRSRLVSRARFPFHQSRGTDFADSASQLRFACALRYESHIRAPEIGGQEVFFESPGLSTKLLWNPQNSSFIHRVCTGLSPSLPRFGLVRGRVSPRRILDHKWERIADCMIAGLNGRRCASNSPSL